MSEFKPDNFNDRISDRSKAKAAEFERAKKRAAAMSETSAARTAERARIAKERDERIAAREAAKKAEEERIAAEIKAAEDLRLAEEEAARIAEETRQREYDDARAKAVGAKADEIRKYADLLGGYKAARKASRRA